MVVPAVGGLLVKVVATVVVLVVVLIGVVAAVGIVDSASSCWLLRAVGEAVEEAGVLLALVVCRSVGRRRSRRQGARDMRNAQCWVVVSGSRLLQGSGGEVCLVRCAGAWPRLVGCVGRVVLLWSRSRWSSAGSGLSLSGVSGYRPCSVARYPCVARPVSRLCICMYTRNLMVRLRFNMAVW